ncbi:MAG: recombinase RecX, partial [Crocinitomicaceae bacterium]
LKKISSHLFQKGISKEVIDKAISSISSEEISGTLTLLYEKKWMSLSNETDPFKRKQKTLRYLLSKGYSYDEISIYFD